MADHTRKQQNEVEQFARQHGIKPDEARKLMAEAGDDPAKLTKAVAEAKVGTRHKDSN
ncbi:MAG: hypothetical protein ABWZ57_01525 [Mesorhizobium sp.]|jgi:hypothetical protein